MVRGQWDNSREVVKREEGRMSWPSYGTWVGEA